MSTQTAQSTGGRFDPSNQPGAQARPKKAVTFKILKVKDAVATGQNQDGDYDVAEFETQATNGSSAAFPSLMFRPEMFSIPNLKAAESLYAENSMNLAGLEELTQKGKRRGESFYWVYKLNILPRVVTNAKTGKRQPDGCTPLMALAGGTLEGLEALLSRFDDAIDALPADRIGPLGFKELTSQEIVAILNGYLRDTGSPEILAVLKQSSRNGELSDRYEIGYYVGEFNSETHKRTEASAKKSATKEVGKRLTITYSV